MKPTRISCTLLLGLATVLGAVLLGPAPAPVERIQGQTRWQILLKSSRDKDASATALRRLANKCRDFQNAPSVKIQLNMDPMSMI